MLLVEFSLEVVHHLLEGLHISHTELVHVLLEVCLLMVNLALEPDDFLSQGKFICNGSMKGNTDVH